MITCIHYQQVIRTYICAYNYYVMYNNDHSYINRYVAISCNSYVHETKNKKINVTNKLTEMNRPRSISYVYMLYLLCF